jgi:hypothetical protein
MAAALALGAAGQDAAPERATQERALHSNAYTWLRELSDSVGPRLTGSAEDARAAEWALQRMRQIGLEHVCREPWQLRSGWQRGRATAELTAPVRLPLAVASYG